MSKSCDNLKHNKLVILSQSKYFILSRWPKNSLDIFVILCIPDFCVTIFHMQSIHLYTTPVISHSLSSNNIRESDELLTACFYSSFLWKFSVSNWAFFHTIRNAQVLFPLNISKKVRKKNHYISTVFSPVCLEIKFWQSYWQLNIYSDTSFNRQLQSKRLLFEFNQNMLFTLFSKFSIRHCTRKFLTATSLKTPWLFLIT